MNPLALSMSWIVHVVGELFKRLEQDKDSLTFECRTARVFEEAKSQLKFSKLSWPRFMAK